MSALPKILVIVGPTASSKTALSLELAKKYNGEIVNADSRQIYRGMDIGTAKIEFNDANFMAGGVKHHLIDVAEPNEEFSLAHFKNAAFGAIDDILSRGKLPIIVGGTGLYVQAIVDNLDIPAIAPDLELRAGLEKKDVGELAEMLRQSDPEAYGRIDIKNPRRVIRALEVAMSEKNGLVRKAGKLPSKYDALQIGLTIPREELVKRINERVDEQISRGLVEEVRGLAEKHSWDLTAMSGIGYKQIGYFLKGKMTLPEAIELIKRDTRRYAKRQMTWFKRDKNIRWVSDAGEADSLVAKFVKK
jgi:tRNA dimethylallyltransferase